MIDPQVYIGFLMSYIYITMTLYINVGHCFLDIYGQIIVGNCFSDICGQIIVMHSSECIHLHFCFTLQINTDKME